MGCEMMGQIEEKETEMLKDFFCFVGCMLGEGVEFMTKVEIYEAIKKEWWKKAKQLYPPSPLPF